MSRITVIGGTGYAGSAIVAEAASRGHEVTSFSRSLPATQLDNVTYVTGDASDESAIQPVIDDADVVAVALAPRGPLEASYRQVVADIGRLADAAGARLVIVGGFSTLRPAPGAPRFVSDLSSVPTEFLTEIRTAAALILEDLPATPDSLDWLFVSPAQGFGSYNPGERLGHYRLGDEVAVEPDGGGSISAPDYALGFVDLIEADDHHRSQVNLAY